MDHTDHGGVVVPWTLRTMYHMGHTEHTCLIVTCALRLIYGFWVVVPTYLDVLLDTLASLFRYHDLIHIVMLAQMRDLNHLLSMGMSELILWGSEVILCVYIYK
jgi:hypothetical protein